MLVSFLFSLGTIILPVLALVYFHKGFKRKAFIFLPMSIILNYALIGVSSALSFKYIDFGWLKYICVISVSLFFVYLILRYFNVTNLLSFKECYDLKWILFFACVALMAIVANFYVLNKQGFNFDNPQNSYFRNPFHSDNQRNVIIVNALIRGDGSPFLPGTELAYQVFWHHSTALFVSLMEAPSNYRFVQGVTLATGFILFFVVFWMLYLLRPEFFSNIRISVLFLIIFITHTDIFHLLYSFFFTRGLGTEADGGCRVILFRSFSLNITTLTAPQHTLFLIFLTLYLVIFERRKKTHPCYWIHSLVFCLCFTASPILSILFFPFFFFHEWLKLFKKREKKTICLFPVKWTGAILLAIVFHWFVLRFSPLDLFLRKGIVDLNLQLTGIGGYLHLPLILIVSAGIPGIIASIIILYNFVLHNFLNKKDVFWAHYSATVLITGSFVANYIITNHEVRRHFSILLSLIVIIYIVRTIPIKQVFHKISWISSLVIAVIIACYLTIFLAYCYTSRSNLLNPKINYMDYFSVNKIIKRRYPNQPVMAASVSGLGCRLPIVMEVATSFSRIPDIFVHSKVSSVQYELLTANKLDMKRLGYKLILWGPIEKMVWDKKMTEQIFKKQNLLETCGSVQLYRLE
jgi:hypothetical protein